jgi:hypothetical protein
MCVPLLYGVYNLAGETTNTSFSTIANNFLNNDDVAVDGSENIYMAVTASGNTGTGAFKFGIAMSGPSTGNVAKIILNSAAAPVTLQVDAAGDLFYADGSFVSYSSPYLRRQVLFC